MATYVKEFNGYIADVPRLWFKRCDKRIFYFDELTAATVTPQVNYTEVNAGWSLYPVAYLPGQSTFEMQVTSGKFEADLFVMANAQNFQDLTNGSTPYEMSFTEVLTPSVDGTQTTLKTASLAHAPITDTISVAYPNSDGKMVATTGSVAAGQYKIIAPVGTEEEWQIQFFAADIADEVTVSYYYDLVAEGNEVSESKIDNRSSAIGEAIMIYPVYGSGDDCSDSSIIGNVIVKVYRCRVTAAPGFDASYKTANTFQFTLAAMDAKRPDNATYSIAFVRKNGGIM